MSLTDNFYMKPSQPGSIEWKLRLFGIIYKEKGVLIGKEREKDDIYKKGKIENMKLYRVYNV